MTSSSRSDAALERWLASQRWFARSDGSTTIATRDDRPLGTDPEVTITLLTTAEDDQYQLVRRGPGPDRTTDPATAEQLGRFLAAGATATGTDGARIRARWVAPTPPGPARARPLGAEQTNTSVVIGGTHVAKVLRRLRAGAHPEVDIGLHLRGSGAPVADLAGWYELVDAAGASTVLGVVHDLVPGALDGWALVLSALAGDPGAVLSRLHTLGRAVADLHDALARPGADDTFGRTALDGTAVWALADRLRADPIIGDEGHHVVAHAVAGIGADSGQAIRAHNDLHLGQTLYGPDGWVIFDFEGEPTRPMAERVGRQSPLRDVAGLLRSVAYALSTHNRTGRVPVDAGWERAARAAVLDGYLSTIEPDLLPTSAAAAHHLLTLFELEKVAYEVAYEQAHRPDWEAIPRAGLTQILARELR